MTISYKWLNHATWKTPRWKTALVRNKISQPARLGIQNGFIKPGETFFDFGCGQGNDVQFLLEQGVIASGFDAYYSPKRPLFEATVVQTAFVLNVIEDEAERREVLQLCWQLTTSTLIVAVQPYNLSKGRTGSGITNVGTFQMYFSNAQLKEFVTDSLGNVRVQVLGSGIVAIT
jgi:DNA phosphorothioation-associated putative methyltransferase